MNRINGIEAVELLPSADPALAHAARMRGHHPVVERTATQPPTLNGIEAVIFGTTASGPGSIIRLDSADVALARAARQRGQRVLVVINSAGAIVAATPAAPANTSVPTISGSAIEGQQLFASEGVWTGSPAPTLTYQWQADTAGNNTFANIGGATASTYTLTSGEVGDKVRVVVTGTNASGSASANSAATAIVTGLPGEAPDAPTLTWDTPSSDDTPSFTIAMAEDALENDEPELQIDTDSGFGSPDTVQDTYDAGEVIAGEIIITLSRLTNGTYYARARNVRGAEVSPWTSTVTVTIAADQTAPTLSSATGTKTGTTTADLSVSTNEGNGTVYWVVTTSATAPSAAQIIAGQNHLGAAAPDSGQQSVAGTGVQTITGGAAGLNAATTYYAHYMHQDAAGNQSSVASSASFTTDSGVSYTANGVRLDGTDYMSRGAALTGAAAGKVGIASLWFKMKGGDATQQCIFGRNLSSGISLQRTGSNRLQVKGINNVSAVVLDMSSVSGTTYTSAMSDWAHLLIAWDLAAGVAQMYINGSDVRAASPTVTNDNINYGTPDFVVGAIVGGTLALNAELADVYINMAATLDISVQANREKFILGGFPVDLGANGELPTGSSPIVYLHGPTASWHTNDGTGGGFTLTGTLADAADSPSV